MFLSYFNQILTGRKPKYNQKKISKRKQNLEIRYLNTDLDLVASVDLALLAATFESKGVFPLHVTRGENGLWSATFETEEEYEDPESNITAMLSVIEQLDEPERSVWQSLTVCEFNIGYDCGTKPWAFNQGLSNDLLRRIAEVKASLRVTLYPPESLYNKDRQPQ